MAPSRSASMPRCLYAYVGPNRQHAAVEVLSASAERSARDARGAKRTLRSELMAETGTRAVAP